MGCTLSLRSIFGLCSIFNFAGIVLAQPAIIPRTKGEFLHFVLTDVRIEPNYLVFNIQCIDYTGPVIADPGYFGLYLIESGELDTLPGLLFAENRLLSDSAIILNTKYQECCNASWRPPSHHRFYRQAKHDLKDLLREHTVLDIGQNRWKLDPKMKTRDIAAFIYIMFLFQVPIYSNGIGYWIDTQSTPYYLLDKN